MTQGWELRAEQRKRDLCWYVSKNTEYYKKRIYNLSCLGCFSHHNLLRKLFRRPGGRNEERRTSLVIEINSNNFYSPSRMCVTECRTSSNVMRLTSVPPRPFICPPPGLSLMVVSQQRGHRSSNLNLDILVWLFESYLLFIWRNPLHFTDTPDMLISIWKVQTSALWRKISSKITYDDGSCWKLKLLTFDIKC